MNIYFVEFTFKMNKSHYKYYINSSFLHQSLGMNAFSLIQAKLLNVTNSDTEYYRLGPLVFKIEMI